MLNHALTIALLLAGTCGFAQDQQPTPQTEGKPQVKVNYLNVCTPGTDEQAIIKNALTAVEGKPVFSADFELSRGRTSLKDAPDAKYMRLRRDFMADSPLMTAQYSISTDPTNTIEILVLRARDPKDFLEIVMEDRVTAGTSTPLTVLSVDTPASRVRIERLNKSSAVLTRCPETDQSAYDPVFKEASEIMARYRAALGLRSAFRSDIAWLNASDKAAAASNPKSAPAKKPAAKKP